MEFTSGEIQTIARLIAQERLRIDTVTVASAKRQAELLTGEANLGVLEETFDAIIGKLYKV